MATIFGISKKEFYNQLNKHRAQFPFAALKAGGAICTKKPFLAKIKALYRLGLIPIMIHGAGEQIDAALRKKGIDPESQKMPNGTRKTDKETLKIVIDEIYKVNNQITAELGDISVGLHQVFVAEPLTADKNDYTGKVAGVIRTEINKCLFNRKIPVISPLGVYYPKVPVPYQEVPYNINADVCLVSIVKTFNPYKVLILSPKAGIYKGNELKRDLNRDSLNALVREGYIKKGQGMGVKVESIRKIIRTHDVQLFSAEHIMRELFTRYGFGTYIHKDAIRIKEGYKKD